MFNQITLIGRLGTEPEIRTIPNSDGKQVANLSVATSHSFKQNGQKMEETEWHSVVVFNGLVNVVQNYLHKGDLVFIEGRLRTRKWQDQSGQDRYKTEVVCNELRMLGNNATGSHQGQSSQAQQMAQQPVQQQPAQQQAPQNYQSQQPPSKQAQPAQQNNNYQPPKAAQQAQQPQSQQQSYYQQPSSYAQTKEPVF